MPQTQISINQVLYLRRRVFYCYRLVNFISFYLSPSDHITRLPTVSPLQISQKTVFRKYFISYLNSMKIDCELIFQLLSIFNYLFHHFFSVSFRRKLCDVVFLKTLTVDRRLKLNCRNVANETVALLGTALDGDVADADLVCWNIMFVGHCSLLQNLSISKCFPFCLSIVLIKSFTVCKSFFLTQNQHFVVSILLVKIKQKYSLITYVDLELKFSINKYTDFKT